MTALFRAPLLALMLLLAAGMAHAHAVLIETTPEDGSLLDAGPEAVHMRFNEAVSPLAIRLTAPDGTSTDLTDRTPGAVELVIPIDETGRGTHVLSWRVASEDGHPVAGTVLFSVGEVTGGAPVTQGEPGVFIAIWLARFLMTAGLVLGIGGAAFGGFAGLVAPARRHVAGATILGGLATVAYLGLNGLDALGLGFAALVTPAPWAASWGTSFGTSAAMILAAVALALAGLRWRALAWVALALLAVAYALSGHAGTAEPRQISRTAVTIHLVVVGFWIGALVPLLLSLREGARGLHRFSVVIPFAVALLLFSGVAMGRLQMGTDPTQWRSAYGYIFGTKLALVAILLVLAAFNRWKLTTPALAGDAAGLRGMRRSIGLELVLALTIIGLTAGWRLTPPPRALAAAHAAQPPAYGHLHSEALMANLVATPGAAGPVSVEIQLTDGDMVPMPAQAVTLHLSQPERGIERVTREAAAIDAAGGIWQISDLVLPLAGDWTVSLDIRLTRFQMATLAGELKIR